MYRQLASALLLLCSVCEARTSPAESPTTKPAFGITVGPETTIVAGPLRSDGTVDIPAAMNVRFGRGVTPENNAVCQLIRVIPLRHGEPASAAKAFAMLGIEPSAVGQVVWHRLADYAPAGKSEVSSFYLAFSNAQTRPWSPDETPALQRWIEANQAGMEIAIDASNLPRFWFPIVPARSDPPMLVGHVTLDPAIRLELLRALCARAMLRARAGDLQPALNDLIAARRLSWLFSQSYELLDHGISLFGTRLVCKAIWALLQESRLSDEQSRDLLSKLRAASPMAECRPAYDAEELQFVDAVQVLAGTYAEAMEKAIPSGTRPEVARVMKSTALRLSPDWNEVLTVGLRGFEDEYLAGDESLSIQSRQQHRKALDDRLDRWERHDPDSNPYHLDEDAAANSWILPRPSDTRPSYSERIGVRVASMMVPSMRDRTRDLRVADDVVQWTEVAVALSSYRAVRAEYPPNLASMVPAILPQIPPAPRDYAVQYTRKSRGYTLILIPGVSARSDAGGPTQPLMRIDVER